MDKSTVLTMVGPHLAKLSTVDNAMAIQHWMRARTLCEIKEMIVWKKSPYKSFRKFCEEEIKSLKYNTIIVYISNYRKMRKNFTWDQIEQICKGVSYSRAIQTMATLPAKVSPTVFKQQAQNLKTVHRQTGVAKGNRIQAVISDAHLNKLESLLAPYGFQIDANGNKWGISKALEAYLDSI